MDLQFINKNLFHWLVFFKVKKFVCSFRQQNNTNNLIIFAHNIKKAPILFGQVFFNLIHQSISKWFCGNKISYIVANGICPHVQFFNKSVKNLPSSPSKSFKNGLLNSKTCHTKSFFSNVFIPIF